MRPEPRLRFRWMNSKTKQQRTDNFIKDVSPSLYPIMRYRIFIQINKADELGAIATVVH